MCKFIISALDRTGRGDVRSGESSAMRRAMYSMHGITMGTTHRDREPIIRITLARQIYEYIKCSFGMSTAELILMCYELSISARCIRVPYSWVVRQVASGQGPLSTILVVSTVLTDPGVAILVVASLRSAYACRSQHTIQHVRVPDCILTRLELPSPVVNPPS